MANRKRKTYARMQFGGRMTTAKQKSIRTARRKIIRSVNRVSKMTRKLNKRGNSGLRTDGAKQSKKFHAVKAKLWSRKAINHYFKDDGEAGCQTCGGMEIMHPPRPTRKNPRSPRSQANMLRNVKGRSLLLQQNIGSKWIDICNYPATPDNEQKLLAMAKRLAAINGIFRVVAK